MKEQGDMDIKDSQIKIIENRLNYINDRVNAMYSKNEGLKM